MNRSVTVAKTAGLLAALVMSLLVVPGMASLARAQSAGVEPGPPHSSFLGTPVPLSEKFRFNVQGDYVAAGIGLRNTTGSGSITVSLPAGSTIVKAFLYWAAMDNAVSGTLASGTFNGNSITGTLVGSDASPCWPPTTIFTFRADVTSFAVAGTNTVNLASSVDPNGTPLLEGASLVVVFSKPGAPARTVIIQDGAVSFAQPPPVSTTFSNFNAFGSPVQARTTWIVADGQQAAGLNNRILIDGTEIANHVLNGAGPGTQFWDTRTDDISSFIPSGDTSVTVAIESSTDTSTYDCLTWVAQVLSVTKQNQVPVANPQNVMTPEDTAVPITLTGSDPEGTALSFSLVSGPSNGTLSGTPPNLTYTPNANFHGSDSFTFTVSDGLATSSPATVSITVTPVNDAPVATNDSYSTNEDTPLSTGAPGVLGNDTDVDSAGLSAVLVSGPSNGALTLNTNGSFTYTPNLNFFGTDSFTYKANDGQLDSNVATVTITVTSVNDAPSFTKGPNQTRFEDEGPQTVPFWAQNISAGPANESGQALNFIVTNDNNALFSTQPAVAPDGTLTFTSAPNANGVANVTVKLMDDGGTANGGVDTSAPQFFTITVEPVNDPPVTTADSKSMAEDTALTFPAGDLTVNDTPGPANESGQTLTVTAVSSPSTAGGTVALGAGTVTYTPAANFFGPDSFTYTVCDNVAPSLCATGTVNVTVTPINDAPVNTVPGAQSTNEDTPLVFSSSTGNAISITDVDAGSNPVQVTLTATNGILTLSGTTGLSFTTGDGTADPSMVFTGTLANVNAALNGLSFAPTPNFNGSASLTITSNDQGFTGSGGAQSDIDTVLISITAANDPPVAGNDTATVAEDSVENVIDVLANDTDEEGDALTVTAVTPGANGTVTIVTQLPPTRPQRVSVASDGTQQMFGAIVVGRPRPAVSANGRFVAFESNAPNLVPGDLNVSRDVFVHDRQTGQTTRVSVGSAGTEANGNSFTPALSADGRFVAFASDATNLVSVDTDSFFDIFVHDRATGQTTIASVASDGTKANERSFSPVISADGRFVGYRSLATNLVPGGPPPGGAYLHDRVTGVTEAISVTVDGAVVDGVVGGISDDGRFVVFGSVSPNLVPGDAGGARHTYVRDRQTGQNSLVSVASDGTKANSNADPASFGGSISGDGRFVVFKSDASNLVPGDTNATSDIFVRDRQFGLTTRVSVASDGSQANGFSDHGGLSRDGRFVVFESAASNLVSGDTNALTDVFIHDRQTGQTARVSVSPDSGEGNGASFQPVVSGDNRFVVFGSFASNLVPNDTNGIEDYFVVHNPVVPATVVRYTPAANFNGTDGFTYTISDGHGGSATGTVTVTVTPVNDKPTASASPTSLTVNEDAPATTVTLSGTDIETAAANLVFTITQAPANGTLKLGLTTLLAGSTFIGSPKDVTYQPNANFNGADSFAFKVTDTADGSSPALDSDAVTVPIAVNAVNDPPAFDAIANQTVAEDASAQTVSITGVSAGPADEAGQTVTLTAVSSNTTVIPNPTITGTGASRSLSYQPVANANGTATITVTANDGQPTNNTFQRTFTISVNPVNDAPVAIAQSVTTGSPVTIVLNGTDLETAAENLTYTVVSGPANGTLDPPVTGRIRTYIPNSGFSGTDSFTFTVTDRGDPDNCGPVSTGCAGALTSPSATVSITVPASAGLTITKFANPSPVLSGRTLTYTVTVRNLNVAPGDATGVAVTDAVPAGTTFASVTTTQGSCTVGGTGTVTCSLGSLAAGATASITLTVTVTAAAGSTITNTATVSALTGDPNTADNSATATTSVIAGSTTSTALSVPTILAPAANGSPSAPQGLGNIQIDENAASSLDTANRVELQLPAGLTFSSVPAVSTVVSNGLTLVLSGTDGPRLDTPSRFSFKIASQSSGGTGGIILISNISVVVAPGFPPGPVLVTVNGANTGITTTSVQNGTAVAPSNTPVLSAVSPTSVGQGTLATASRPLDGTIVLSGVNFNPDASVTFSPDTGITVNGVTVNSATQITASITVATDAPVDPIGTGRGVTVTNPINDTNPVAQSATLPGIFRVTAAPSVTDTDRHGLDAQGCSRGLFRGIFNQVVNIVATNVQSPLPPGISVEFGGLGISLVPGSIEQTLTGVKVRVDVGSALTTSLGEQAVTVINPDGGRGQGVITLSGPGGFVEIVDPPAPGSGCPGAEEGLAGGQGQGGPPTQEPTEPAPTIASITPSSGFTATSVTISGSDFSTATNGNSVKFSGADAVTATSNGSSITVTVPATAVDGLVTVTKVSTGQVSNGVNFNVTDPRLTGVSPTGADRGALGVSLTLSGSEFSGGLDVTFSPADGITILAPGAVASSDGTITLTIDITSTAPTGLRDVTVTKTVEGVSRSSTLAGSFEVRAPATQGFNFEVVGLADASTYLPTVAAVSVTLGSNGQCTAKSITPQAVTLRATFFSSTGASPPSRVDVRITSVTTLRGTASTEDCEPPGASAINDFSITAASATTGTQNQILVERVSNSGGGTYDVKLWSWDWGGTVTVRVNDRANTAVASSITLPVDTDGDGLPNAYEASATLNADKNNNNVLNQTIFDQNGNGTADGQDRFALDGLTNFEKFRRVCLKGPANGTTGPITDCIQLGAGMRNLFVRGRGFGDDPAITSGSTCGINPSTGAAVADSTACPPFAVGTAFANEGVKVHNVSTSFTSATVFPKVTMDPTKTAGTATLDMATVVYDAVGCASGETCDHTAKSGVRQWNFPTLGFSGFGSSSAYATDAKIFKKGVDAYFKDKPYEHRTNDPARVVTAPDGRAMLAPITIVGDSSSQGSDNGLIDSAEATVAGQLAGDTYIPNAFNKQLSAMDATNDGCVELPFVSDPTTLSTACNPAAETANPGPQATKRQVVRSLITHELGHAVGVNIHTTVDTDIMYEYTTNWTRDNHFSPTAAALIQIHNKGLQ